MKLGVQVLLGRRLRSGSGSGGGCHLLGLGKEHFNIAKIAAYVFCARNQLWRMEASQISSKFILFSSISFAMSQLLITCLLLLLLLSGGCRGDALEDCRGIDRR